MALRTRHPGKAGRPRGRQKLYGVFAKGQFKMTFNKADALRAARLNKGIVRSVPDDPSIRAWDARTFKIVSDPVADFTA